MTLPSAITFRGKQLLLLEPHAVDSKPLLRALRNSEAAAISGARILETNSEHPGGIHQLDFVCETRADVRVLEDFFDGRQAAFEGFWVPTWQWEFEFADYDGGSPPFTDYHWIRKCSYSDALFPLGDPYRYLLLLYADRYWVRYVLDVDGDNPVGGLYERLNLQDSAASVGYFDGLPKPFAEAKGVRPLWLRFVRFADDEIVTQELGEDSALVTVRVQELPLETP
jgi:hypothetical protein